MKQSYEEMRPFNVSKEKNFIILAISIFVILLCVTNVFALAHCRIVLFSFVSVLNDNLSKVEITRAKNVLPNGDFEQICKSCKNEQSSPAFWQFESCTGKAEFKLTKNAYSGQYAIKLILSDNPNRRCTSRPRASLVSPILRVKSGTYRLSGCYKAKGNAIAHMQYVINDEKFDEYLPSTDSWREFSFLISVWNDYKIMTGYLKQIEGNKLVIKLGANKGNVLYDKVSLIHIVEPIMLRIFPAEYRRNNVISFINGMPGFCRIMFIGNREQIYNSDVRVSVYMPKGTKSFGLLDKNKHIIIDGREYIEFIAKVPKSQIEIMKPNRVSHASIILWFKLSDISARNNYAYFRAVVDGKQLSTKRMKLKILPKLVQARCPSRFKNFVCWSTFGNKSVPEKLYPSVYSLIRAMGVNTVLTRGIESQRGWHRYLIEHLRKDGGFLWASVPSKRDNPFLVRWGERGWETKVIAEGEGYFARESGAYYKKLQRVIDGVFWDYEPYNANRAPYWDDEQTKRAFAAKYGYKVESLTDSKLKGEFREQWLRFRTWQIGEIVRLWARYVHGIRPDWEIAVSQGAGFPLERYVPYDAYNDISGIIHLPQIYLDKPCKYVNNIAKLRKYLPSAKFLPVCTSYMVADKSWPAKVSPKTLYLYYVSSAMLGCVGCGHWPDIERGMDMEYIWEIARAARDIGIIEGYVYKGIPARNVTVEVITKGIDWQKNLLFRAYRLNGKTLVAFINLHATQDADVKVTLKNGADGKWSVYEPIADKIILSCRKSEFIYRVPAYKVGIIIIKRCENNR